MFVDTHTPRSFRLHRTVRAAGFAGLLFSGIFAGFLVAVLVLELSMRDVDASAYTQVRHVELVGLDVLAAVTLLPALVITALLIVVNFRDKGRSLWLTALACALFAGILILTLVVNLPINADQRDWTVAMPPTDWAAVRDHWQISHAVRTVAAVLAFGALIAASVVPQRRDLGR